MEEEKCKYCTEPTRYIRAQRQFTDSNIEEIFISTAPTDGAGLFMRQSIVTKLTDKGVEHRQGQENKYVYIGIQYCPFCGRKLSPLLSGNKK